MIKNTAHTEPEDEETTDTDRKEWWRATGIWWMEACREAWKQRDEAWARIETLTAQEGEIWPKTVDGTDGSQTYRKPAQEDEPCHSDDYHRGVRYGMKLRADADALTARPVAWKDMPPSSFGVDFGATLESDTEPEDGEE